MWRDCDIVAVERNTFAHAYIDHRSNEVAKMVKEAPVIQTLSVPAIVYGGKAILLDQDGNALARNVQLARLTGSFDSSRVDRWHWLLAARYMLYRVSNARCRARQNPWLTKSNALAHSLRLRSGLRSTQGTLSI